MKSLGVNTPNPHDIYRRLGPEHVLRLEYSLHCALRRSMAAYAAV